MAEQAPKNGALADRRQIVNSVLTAVLLAAIFGGWRFYETTRTDILMLRSDVARVEEKVDRIAEIIDRVHGPRAPTPAPAPTPTP